MFVKTDNTKLDNEFDRLIHKIQEKSKKHMSKYLSDRIESNMGIYTNQGLPNQQYIVNYFEFATVDAYHDLANNSELSPQSINHLESEYREWQSKFDKLIDDTWQAYSEYRAAVRDILYL
ncbi:hypothetical protein ACFLV5_02870 [Chloroflexota bacterium]